MTTKAYFTLRPIDVGTYPGGYTEIGREDFPHRMFVEEIGREAYGWIEWAEDVPRQELDRYDLVTGKAHDARFDGALKAMVGRWTSGADNREDLVLGILDKAEAVYGIDRDELYGAFETAIDELGAW